MMKQCARYMVYATLTAGALLLGLNPSSAQEKVRLAMAGPATTYHLPHFVAAKKGLYGNLNVEEVFVNGDANALRALLANGADAIMMGAAGTLLAIEQGAKVKAIGAGQPIQDYNLVVQPNGPDNITGLGGKVFATTGPGNIPDVLSRLLLKKHGVDPNTMRFITVTGGHAGMFGAVAAGRADGAIVNTITAEQGAKAGQAKVLLPVAKELPDFGYVYTVARQETIDDPKGAAHLGQLVDGMIKASRFITDDPDAAAEILRERLPDFDIEFLRGVVRKLSDNKVWGVDGGIERSTVTETIKLYQGAGLLPKELPVDEAFDYRFVNTALKK